jgi:opacity protein-like surface antigen
MKSSARFLILVSSLVSASAMAQMAQFTGWNAGLNVNFNNAKSKTDSDSLSNQNTGGSLHGGYGFAINNDYAVLLDLDMTLDKIKTGETNDTSIYFKSPAALSVAPAMLLNDSTLLYAKVSYESANFNYKTTNKAMNGYGLAAGARYILSKGVYLQAELKGIKYNEIKVDDNNVNSSNSQVNIGIGFNF